MYRDRTAFRGPRWVHALPLALLVVAGPAPAETEMLDQVVAIVDDDVIMASEMRERLSTVLEGIEARGVEAPPEDELIREILDRLILESIQLQLGDRYGVRIADAQLDAAMTRIAAQNRLSPEQFAILLEQEGQSYAEVRDTIRREMVIQRVQQGNVNQLIEISDQEIENYLSTEEGQKLVQPEYRIVHALLPVPSGASEDDIERSRLHAEGLIAQIRAGEAFDEVISASSGDYTFSGGDLGWRKLDDVPSIFQDVAQTLATGEVADLFRSPSGFHIVRMADRRGAELTIPQTRVRHILVKPSEILTDEQAKQRIVDIKARVEGGEDFEALAREFSEDIGSAAEGGDLGWTNPGQMVPEFENMMASTPEGELSEPVRSQFGWHLIEVLERREKDMTEEMRRAQIEEFLHQRKYQEELDAWLRKIRDEAFVDIK